MHRYPLGHLLYGLNKINDAEKEGAGMEKSFNEERPSRGEKIMVLFPDKIWYECVYYDEGIEGIVVDEADGIETEIEEYGSEMIWK